jgi:DNA repair protein RecO (recombination protein O)
MRVDPMALLKTPAILLRKTDYGDFDLILTVFSLRQGKLSLIVKSGKKSKKRFAGVLELFSQMEIVASRGRRGRLAVLQEASLREPYANIRSDIRKTAYASYWTELVNAWMEENVGSAPLFALLAYVLEALDRERDSAEALSIIFQIQFLNLSGHSPNLGACSACRRNLDGLNQPFFGFSLSAGGILCRDCGGSDDSIRLSTGTVKQLLWAQSGDLRKAARIRFGSEGTREALAFLEAFVPYHLGRQLKSLKFLRQIRRKID